MEEITCPVCNIALRIDEGYDGFMGINVREEEWFGQCPRCGREYHWTEVYVYKETKNFGIYVEEET